MPIGGDLTVNIKPKIGREESPQKNTPADQNWDGKSAIENRSLAKFSKIRNNSAKPSQKGQNPYRPNSAKTTTSKRPVTGKAKKVAPVACMRKLLTTLNAMVKAGQNWGEKPLALDNT